MILTKEIQEDIREKAAIGQPRLVLLFQASIALDAAIKGLKEGAVEASSDLAQLAADLLRSARSAPR